MKDHTSRHEITARELWEVEDLTYREIAERIELSHGSVSRRAIELNFVRRRGGGEVECGYEAGPCLECGVPYPRDEINEDYLCPICEEIDPTGPYHLHRWGRRPPDPDHPDWMDLERIARDYRMRDPEREFDFKRPIFPPHADALAS